MRAQKRAEEPAVLRDNKTKWTAAWLKGREQKPAAKFSWPTAIKKPKSKHETAEGKKLRMLNHILRPVLATQTQDHCSFCDSSPIEPPGKETIEHFRPKSTYAEHAFAWDNLFLACSCCQLAKGEAFDEALLKPDEKGYQFDDWFLADMTDGRLEPHPRLRDAELDRAKKTIKLSGLDSPNQRTARKLWIHHYGPRPKGSEIDMLPFREWMKYLV